MERLGVERFPLLYIHDPMDMPMDLVMSERGTLGALRTLQKRGLLDYVGVAANDPVTNATYIETGEFDAAVVPEAWSLINRLAEERIFPAAERHGTGLVIATPLELGLLVVGARETNTFPRRRFSPEVLVHVRQLETVCERHGVSLAAAALQYVVQHPTVSAVIAGARNPQEARANAAAMQEPIPAAFWDEVRPNAPPLGCRRAPPAARGLAAGQFPNYARSTQQALVGHDSPRIRCRRSSSAFRKARTHSTAASLVSQPGMSTWAREPPASRAS